MLLPYSLRGLPVRIRPLLKTEIREIFSQAFSGFKEPIYSNFEFGTLVLSRGVTAPKITPTEAAELEPQIFTAILSRILEISGVGLKRKETKYLVESLPDDAKLRRALELTRETLTRSGFAGLFDQFILSGRFAETISKWQTYDLQGGLGWDRLSKRRRNALIKRNQLAAATEGASTIIKSDGQRQWVTVVVDFSKVPEPSDLEHFALHEGQHVIDSILGYGRTYAVDEKTILKMLRSRGVRVNAAFVENTLDVINEVFVERRIYHLRREESLRFMTRQIERSREFLLDPRLLVKSRRNTRVVAALGLYVLGRLVVVAAPFREAGKQPPSGLDEVFRRFPALFRDYHERLLNLLGGLSLEQVKPGDVVSAAILLKKFYEKYRRSLTSRRSGNR